MSKWDYDMKQRFGVHNLSATANSDSFFAWLNLGTFWNDDTSMLLCRSLRLIQLINAMISYRVLNQE